MPSANISFPTDVIAGLDKERRWVTRSKAISECLRYLLTNQGTIRSICGANNIPEEYKDEIDKPTQN